MRKQVLCAVILSGFTTLAAHAQNAVSGQVAVDYVPLSNYIRLKIVLRQVQRAILGGYSLTWKFHYLPK
ncbi:hypothetical protein GCM10009120_57070 [Sphingobacterium siyangense subsp. cladoniae]|uniref:hypothetical protein n=1 Tax=Sphingobacterium siyangense TaxID=459529 RepID=UPI0031F9AD61